MKKIIIKNSLFLTCIILLFSYQISWAVTIISETTEFILNDSSNNGSFGFNLDLSENGTFVITDCYNKSDFMTAYCTMIGI